MRLYKQAICMRPDDEPFLLFGPPFMTGDGLKKVHFGPKTAKHGRLVNVPKWSERVQNGGPKSKKRLLTRSPICGLLVEPQNAPFGT